jgi:hypothetical protein
MLVGVGILCRRGMMTAMPVLTPRALMSMVTLGRELENQRHTPPTARAF